MFKRHVDVTQVIRRALHSVFWGVNDSLHHREAQRIRRELHTGAPSEALARDWCAVSTDLKRAIERHRSFVEQR